VVQSDVYDKQICDLETSISHSLRMISQPLYLRKVRNNHALRIITSQQIHNCGTFMTSFCYEAGSEIP
jgi:hypothetical protein